jgi:hypothetical protein
LEQKVASVTNATAMRVSKIMNVLKFHYLSTRALSETDQVASFRHVHVLFYEWDDGSTDVSVARADVFSAIREYFIQLNKGQGKSLNIFDIMLSQVFDVQGSSEVSRMQACFDSYLTADTKGKSDSVHACIIGKEVLQEWLVPPVGPIPLLVEKILGKGDGVQPSE